MVFSSCPSTPPKKAYTDIFALLRNLRTKKGMLPDQDNPMLHTLLQVTTPITAALREYALGSTEKLA